MTPATVSRLAALVGGQTELAHLLSVTRDAVCKWERGQRTPRPAMTEAARALLRARIAEARALLRAL